MVLRTSLNIIPILVALQLLKSPTLSIDLVSTAENLQTTGEMLCWSCQGNFAKFNSAQRKFLLLIIKNLFKTKPAK